MTANTIVLMYGVGRHGPEKVVDCLVADFAKLS